MTVAVESVSTYKEREGWSAEEGAAVTGASKRGALSVVWGRAGKLAAVFVAGGALPFLLSGHGAAAASQCPCSLFGSATPSLLDLPAADGRSGDGLSDEVGVRIAVTAPARLNAIRFYEDPLETGAHIGRLWDATGQELAQVSFDSESASGWQSAVLSTPVDLNPGATYTVSVNINAYFVDQYDALNSEIVSGPIRSLADGNNGVFARAAGEYPISSYRSSNYFVDVVVDDVTNDSGTTTTTSSTTTTETTTTTATTTTTVSTTTTAVTATPPSAPTTTTSDTTPTPPASAPQPPISSGSTSAKTVGVSSGEVDPLPIDAAAQTFAAAMRVSTTKSLLPHAPAIPKWPLRVWFRLTALSAPPARLQFAETPQRPWAWRPFRDEITVRTRTHSIWIRFGNASSGLSDWRRISIP